MVKFSKQFEGQLVPEWKEAFVDYWQLKKDLKRMQVLGASQGPTNTPPQTPLAHRLFSPLRKLPFFGSCGHRDHEVIQAFLATALFILLSHLSYKVLLHLSLVYELQSVHMKMSL